MNEILTDYETESLLTPVLTPGEHLVWTGRPKGGVIFRPADIFLIPFSIIWGGFAIFWEVLASTGPFFFWLFGIPFVLAGLYLMVGRFFYDAKKRESTVYGLTQDRIIILSGITRREVRSLSVNSLPEVSFTQKEDGTGSIMFGPTDPRFSSIRGMEWPGTKQPPRLELINDVKAVYDKIVELQRKKAVT